MGRLQKAAACQVIARYDILVGDKGEFREG